MLCKLYAVVTFKELQKLRKWISHHVIERDGFIFSEYFILFLNKGIQFHSI